MFQQRHRRTVADEGFLDDAERDRPQRVETAPVEVRRGGQEVEVPEPQLAQAVANGGLGSQDLGVSRNIQDVIAMHKDMPDLVNQQAHGNIIGDLELCALAAAPRTQREAFIAIRAQTWRNRRLP